jgi:hypothetical protein
MQRKRLGATALIVGLVVCAMAALAGTSGAITSRRYYILRHPRREHCRRHYTRRGVTVKKRIHGHTKKVRQTRCIRLRPKPKPAPSALSPQPPPELTPWQEPITPPPTALAPAREPRPREPKRPAPTCTSTFTGAVDNAWGTAANWSEPVPDGFSSYACIPAEYPSTVTFGPSAEIPTEIGGVSAENAEGVTLQGGHLTLANPEQESLINNVKPGDAVVTLGQGVLLQLTGETGELGGSVWNGPGTLEIPRGAFLRTGDCASWLGKTLTKCVDGTPTGGYGGLQVKNLGTILGAGISLCRNGAAQPAKLENEGSIRIRNSGAFAGASECGEVGSLVNGELGRIGIAELDGKGCNVRVVVASLLNKGSVRLGSCFEPEAEEVHRPTLQIGSSLSEAGTIFDGGIVQIQGDYAPTASASLTIAIKQTFPQGSAETNYGTIKVSGSAALAGELNIETLPKLTPVLGQTFQIVDAGEAAGSLSGEFTLGEHCIPAEPGNGYEVNYQFGSKGTVTLEVANVAGC